MASSLRSPQILARVSLRGTRATIGRYFLSCGWLLVPASLWNIALADRLPDAFAPAEFGRDIPTPLAIAENVSRVAVFALPFCMPLTRIARRQLGPWLIWLAGTLIYFASWLMLILLPTSAWSTSPWGFAAPAYTPLLWLCGIALLGRRLFWGTVYRPWMYLGLTLVFLSAHIGHTALVYARQH